MEVLKIVILKVCCKSCTDLYFYPSTALKETVVWCGDDALSLEHCLNDSTYTAPVDHAHLEMPLNDLVGKTVEICKVYTWKN